MQQLPSRLKDAHGRVLFSRFLGTGPLPPPEWWDSKLKGRDHVSRVAADARVLGVGLCARN